MACIMVIFVITEGTAVLKSPKETIQLNWAKSETVSHVSEVLLRTDPTVSPGSFDDATLLRKILLFVAISFFVLNWFSLGVRKSERYLNF